VQVGQKLTEVSPRGIHAIFERLRHVLHESTLDKRTQYMIEVKFVRYFIVIVSLSMVCMEKLFLLKSVEFCDFRFYECAVYFSGLFLLASSNVASYFSGPEFDSYYLKFSKYFACKYAKIEGGIKSRL
jgi:hypothetical protein